MFGCKEYNHSAFGIDHLVMSMCRTVSCVAGRQHKLSFVFAMTGAFSWEKPVSLFPASFCTPRPKLPVTPGISRFPPFVFQSPMIKRTSFFGVSARRSCRFSENCSTSTSSALQVGA